MMRFLVENNRPRQIVQLFGRVLAPRFAQGPRPVRTMWLDEAQFNSETVQGLFAAKRLVLVKRDPAEEAPEEVEIPAPEPEQDDSDTEPDVVEEIEVPAADPVSDVDTTPDVVEEEVSDELASEEAPEAEEAVSEESKEAEEAVSEDGEDADASSDESAEVDEEESPETARTDSAYTIESVNADLSYRQVQHVAKALGVKASGKEVDIIAGILEARDGDEQLHLLIEAAKEST